MSTHLIDALLDSLDEQHIDRLAELLAARLAPEPATSSPYLTADEAATYLRCSRQAIYDRVHSGALEPRRDGTRLLFHRDDLDAYLTGRNP